MYCESNLDFTLQLRPDEFSLAIQKNILDRLNKKLLYEYFEDKGKVVEVQHVNNIKQMPLVSSGNAEFKVNVSVALFQVEKGNTVLGTVTRVNKLGFYMDETHHQMYLPFHYLSHYIFDKDHYAKEKSIIQVGTKLHVKVIGTRYSPQDAKFHSIIDLA